MPLVYGTLTDFGLDALDGRSPRLTFTAASPGVAGLNVLTTLPVEAVPAANGYFEVDLATTQTVAPATYYVVQIHWIDPTANSRHRSELLPWKLFVPPEGGALGDLLRVPANPALVHTGTDAPFNPAPGTWWLDPTTGDLSEMTQDGTTWDHKANIRGPAGYNAIGYAENAQAIADLVTKKAGPNPLSAETDKMAPRYYDDAGTYADRGAVHTISRNLPAPNGFQPTMWVNVSGKGDNATFKGVVAGQFLARDRTDVTAANKGVLYALQAVVAPIVDRNNVPFDDVVGLAIVNQGSAIGTDALYFGNNRSDRATNPAGLDWSNIIQNDAASSTFVRTIAKHDVGMSFGAATITTTAIRFGSGQSMAWNSGADANVLIHAIRMSTSNTLRLYEGGLDIRADKTAYFGAKAVLGNNTPLRALKFGTTTEADLIKLDATDAVAVAGGALMVFASGDLAINNNKGVQAKNAAGTAYLEIVRLTAGDNLALYGAKATVLAGGGVLLANCTTVPAAPTGASVLYSEGGSLKVKSPSGTVTVLAPA